ncbi:AAA family ATPase [Hungatella hathewayi]|uniref:AAA family ATPase n=1 Tax=Hungatella hathewayi TaxID=154046 RepID=UPI0035658F0D
MKYSDEKVVNAIYTDNILRNPYIEALPEELGKETFMKRIASYPPLPYDLSKKKPEERRHELTVINNIFFPMDYMYNLYDMLYRAILDNYSSKNMIDAIRQINLLRQDFNGTDARNEYSTQSYSGALLGVPGIGKSSSIRRSLSLMPQVIIHTNYNGFSMYQKQIIYLCVECPCDCSVKTLAASIIMAIDQAIGSDYFEDMVKNKRLTSASALAMKVKIACLNHRIGIIVIDEIQNAVITAEKTRQLKPLIKFLVELTNETCVSICFTGTLEAEEIFTSQEHLMRRTRGYRLLPLKPDKSYYDFLSAIWNYQWVLGRNEIKEKIANAIYDYSGGIPSYIIKIFIEAQVQAIMTGTEQISIETIKRVVSILNINVQKTYKGGVSISDFQISKIDLVDKDEKNDDTKAQQKNTTYFATKPKGRPTNRRDLEDLIELYKESSSSNDLKKKMTQINMSEFFRKGQYSC